MVGVASLSVQNIIDRSALTLTLCPMTAPVLASWPAGRVDL